MNKLYKPEDLKKPEFIQEEIFRTIILRKSKTEQAEAQVTTEATQQVTQQVKRLLSVIKHEMSRSEIMKTLNLKDRNSFVENYLGPALVEKLIEMTQPDSPNSPIQKYRLTEKGKRVVGKMGK